MNQPPRRYFDNAATSFPKPPEMSAAIRAYLEQCHASAGRGAYREAVKSGQMLEQCRAALRRLFNASPQDAVVFALNGTDALNIALKGLIRDGQHVITSVMDHNSVLRPLHALREQRRIRWTTLGVDRESTLLDPQALEREIRDDTRLVAINHASNVSGALQPIEALGEICRSRGVPLLLDAAQSAGHVPLDFSSLPVDLLACPGHKGLLGPLGTGVLLIRAGFEQRMLTFREGGTGSLSEHAVQPDAAPDKFESGSHNALGLTGLLASLNWLLQRGVSALRAHEIELCQALIPRLDRVEGLSWYGPRDTAQRVGVFSVRIDGLDPQELSAILEDQFGILTRSGLHCAPFAHRAINTHQSGGTTRLSLGAFTTHEDIDVAADALERTAAALATAR